MKNFCFLLGFVLLSCLSTAALGAGSREGEVRFDVDLSAQNAEEVVNLWLPYPAEDAAQRIHDVRVEGDFAQSSVTTDAAGGVRMLHARWDRGAQSRKLSFSFKVEREEVLHRELPQVEAAWNPADFSAWLGATSLGPVDAEVKAVAEKITAGKTRVQDKAKAVYDWTVENMYRDPDTKGCGIGDVNALLAIPGGKCADIHSVYVALARAAGVPAREVFGIRQGKKQTQDITGWQHCWAEFYLPGYGWVSVDPGDVRKAMLTENLKLEDAKTAEYRAYFWGGIDAYRVKFNTGRDLTLAPVQQGGAVNYLMYPFAQAGGETLDWLEPSTFKYRIDYREI